MAWIAYLTALILGSNGMLEGALIVFVIGVVFHWKYWIAGIVGFFVGVGLSKPF